MTSDEGVTDLNHARFTLCLLALYYKYLVYKKSGSCIRSLLVNFHLAVIASHV